MKYLKQLYKEQLAATLCDLPLPVTRHHFLHSKDANTAPFSGCCYPVLSVGKVAPLNQSTFSTTSSFLALNTGSTHYIINDY